MAITNTIQLEKKKVKKSDFKVGSIVYMITSDLEEYVGKIEFVTDDLVSLKNQTTMIAYTSIIYYKIK